MSVHAAEGILCWATNGRALRGKKGESLTTATESGGREKVERVGEERKKERKEREKGKEKKKEKGREKEQGSTSLCFCECTNMHRRHGDKIRKVFLIHYVSGDPPLCLSYCPCSCCSFTVIRHHTGLWKWAANARGPQGPNKVTWHRQ